MANEFNAERAKAGEKVQINVDADEEWVNVHFVGMSICGTWAATQRTIFDDPKWSELRFVRMAPKPPKVMWVQAYRLENHMNGLYCTNPQETGDKAKEQILMPGKILLGEPQQILIPDES